MKRIYKSLLPIVVCLLAGAITANAQFRWGPAAGVNLSTLKFKQNLFQVDKAVGYSVGVMGEMMFPGIGFGIDAGLLYDQRGADLHLGEKLIWSAQGYGTERVYLHNIEIPVHLRFKWTRMEGLEDYIAPFVFGGPDFAFQVGHGSLKALKYSGGDVGLTAGVGLELWRHWQVSASYTWGMTYACKTTLLTDLSARSRTWHFRVTYLF